MLETMKNMIRRADGEGRAVAAFNVFGYEDAKAVINAAERLGRPVILMVNKPAAAHMGITLIGRLLLQLADEAYVPVGVHLDHASEIEAVKEAVDTGYSSVMLDASQYEFEENVRKTQMAANLAHKAGASVEAEIGAVGYSDMEQYAARYTEPEEARRFYFQTGVDALAVAVGTVHRMKQQTACLQFERLQAIHEAVPVPLVIHGASGVKDEELKKLVECGARKINLGTTLRLAFGKELRRQMEEDKEAFDRIQLFQSCMKVVEERAAEKLALI